MDGKRYLLDTNILSDLIHNPRGVVAGHIHRVGEEAVCTSILVAAELRFGARKRNSDRLTTQVEAVLNAIDVLPWETPYDRTYALIRQQLERAGTPIGANDLLIAAQAVELGVTLVTHNGREFRRIDGLIVEDWLE